MVDVSPPALRPEIRADLRAALHLASAVPAHDRETLADALYAGWFTRFRPVLADGAAPAADLRDHALIARLRLGGGRWAPGGHSDALGGWWTIASPATSPVPAGSLLRVYWNCPADAAAALVAAAAGTLGRLGLPYGLKCPVAGELFDRLDAVVLYLDAADWPRARHALAAVHRSLAPRLRDPVPPLTLRLGRGAAVAEDPGDGGSFGESRARAVADGVLAGRRRGVRREADQLAVVADRLRAHGISVARPHLRAGSSPDLVGPW